MTAPRFVTTMFAQHSLLAVQDRFVHMGRRFRHGGSSVDLKDVLLLVFVLAAVAGAIWLLSRYFSLRESRALNSPHRLFRQLCRAHHLDWTSRRLLHQLALWHRLPHAAQLFVEPHRFDTEKLDATLAAHRDQIADLREKLFAS